MKIVPGVSYHPFDDKVYVHNVESNYDYIFDGIVSDVLDFFSNNDDATLDELCMKLSEDYDVDATELHNDMRDFVEQLLSEKILYEGVTPFPKESWSNRIPMELEQIFSKQHRLFDAGIELTYRCVERCIHCYIDDASNFSAKDELTTDEWKEVLKQIRELGCVKILITGGEVLLRPDLCDIAEYATKLGLIVDIFTTGVGLTDEILDRLRAMKVNTVSVSLYSGIAAEHDKITGLKGSFDKTLKAVLMLKAAGINTFIKGVAIKQNLDSLESLYELGERFNIYVGITANMVSGHEAKCAADYALGDLELYKKFFELKMRYEPHNKIDRQLSREEMLNDAACYAGFCSMSIDPFGNVRPCLSYPEMLGTIREDSLQTLWERTQNFPLKNRVMRNVTTHCNNCEYVGQCKVCVAELINKQHDNPDDCGNILLIAQVASDVKK